MRRIAPIIFDDVLEVWKTNC